MPRCFSISIQSEVAWRRGLARLHAAGDLDRAGEQQQLLGERGLARVGVGDDGEGAAAPHLAREIEGHGGGLSAAHFRPRTNGSHHAEHALHVGLLLADRRHVVQRRSAARPPAPRTITQVARYCDAMQPPAVAIGPRARNGASSTRTPGFHQPGLGGRVGARRHVRRAGPGAPAAACRSTARRSAGAAGRAAAGRAARLLRLGDGAGVDAAAEEHRIGSLANSSGCCASTSRRSSR